MSDNAPDIYEVIRQGFDLPPGTMVLGSTQMVVYIDNKGERRMLTAHHGDRLNAVEIMGYALEVALQVRDTNVAHQERPPRGDA